MSEQHDSPPRPRRRGTSATVGHLVRRGIPIAVLVLVAAGAFLYWNRADHGPDHEAAPGPQGPVPVTVVEVQRHTVPVRLRFLGQTEGSQVVEIRARVAGYLGERLFEEGQRVEKGQKLFQIDPRPFEVELQQAKARVASAEATLARARQQRERFEGMRAQGTASPEELEQWQTEEQVAAAALALQQAQVAAAELQLSYTSIEAPITGMIGQALKDTGSYVDAGQNGLLAVIQQVDPIEVRYSITEQEMLRFQRQIAEGQLIAPAVGEAELEIMLADGSIYPQRGRVNYIDVDVDETTGTSVVRGQVPNPDALLRPGQFIYATVLGVQRVDVVRVPQSAVQQSPTGASVMVVNDKNVVEARPVQLGEWSGTEHWIVERGLEPGDRVVADRLMMVRPGSEVTIGNTVAVAQPQQEQQAPPADQAQSAADRSPATAPAPATASDAASARGEGGR